MKKEVLLIFFISRLFSVQYAQQPLLLPCPVGDKWGYCDTTGAIIIMSAFDFAGYFTNRSNVDQDTLEIWYAPVSCSNGNNLIDRTGRLLVPLDSVREIRLGALNDRLWFLEAKTSARFGNYTALVDKHLNIIRPFEQIGISCPVNWDEEGYRQTFLIRQHGPKYRYDYFGMVDALGRTIIPPKFIQLSNIDNGYYLAQPPELSHPLLYRLPEKMLDTFPYTPMTSISDGLVGVYRSVEGKGTRCGFVDLHGETVVPFEYAQIESFKNGFGVGQRPEGIWEVFDTKGVVRCRLTSRKDLVIDPKHIFIRQSDSSWRGYDSHFRLFLKNADAPPQTLIFEGKKCYRYFTGADSIMLDWNGKELGRHPYRNVKKVRNQNQAENNETPSSICLVQRNGRWGLAVRKGEFQFQEILSPVFDEPFTFWQGRAKVAKDGKFGVIDLDGKILIPPEWDEINYEFGFGCPGLSQFKVRLGGLYGILDSQGKVLIPCILQKDSRPIWMKTGFVWLDTLNGLQYLCDGKGNISTFDSSYIFRLGLYKLDEFAWNPIDKSAFQVRKSGKVGCLDPSGRWILPPVYQTCDITSDLLYAVVLDSLGIWSLLEMSSGMIFPIDSGWLEITGVDVFHYFRSNTQFVSKVWCRESQRFIGPPDGIQMEVYRGGLCRIKDREGRFGFMNDMGVVAIPCEFSMADNFSGGISIVKNTRWGVIDKNGRYLLSPEYFDVQRMPDNYLKVQRDSLSTWSLLDSGGRIIVKDAIQIDSFSDNRFFVWYRQSDHCWGRDTVYSTRMLIDSGGKVILSDLGTQYFPYRKPICPADPEALRGFVDIVQSGMINDSLLWVRMQTGWSGDVAIYGIGGVLKKDGTWVIPLGRHFIKFYPQTSDFAVHQLGGKAALFDVHGWQKTPYMFDYSPEIDFRAPFCYSVNQYDSECNQYWLSFSGKVICFKKK